MHIRSINVNGEKVDISKLPKLFYLELSANGDFIRVSARVADGHFTAPILTDLPDAHPIWKEFENCNSFVKVLALLQKLKAEPELLSEPNTHSTHSSERKPIFTLYHKHHSRYPHHRSPLCFFSLPYLGQYGEIHLDTIDKMISFVQMRQNEEALALSMSPHQRLASTLFSNKWLLSLSTAGFFLSGGSGAMLGAIIGFFKDQVDFYNAPEPVSNEYKFKR